MTADFAAVSASARPGFVQVDLPYPNLLRCLGQRGLTAGDDRHMGAAPRDVLRDGEAKAFAAAGNEDMLHARPRAQPEGGVDQWPIFCGVGATYLPRTLPLKSMGRLPKSHAAITTAAAVAAAATATAATIVTVNRPAMTS